MSNKKVAKRSQVQRAPSVGSLQSHARDPEPAATWVKVDDLKPWSGNPRDNDGRPVEAVAASIKRFGFGAPILARQADGEVIAGHTRLKAMRALRSLWDRDDEAERERWHPEAIRAMGGEAPVRFKDLSDGEAHLLALADNKLNELAAWDADALAGLAVDFGDGLVYAGFALPEIEDLRLSSALADSDFSEFELDNQSRRDGDAESQGSPTCPECGRSLADR